MHYKSILTVSALASLTFLLPGCITPVDGYGYSGGSGGYRSPGYYNEPRYSSSHYNEPRYGSSYHGSSYSSNSHHQDDYRRPSSSSSGHGSSSSGHGSSSSSSNKHYKHGDHYHSSLEALHECEQAHKHSSSKKKDDDKKHSSHR